VVAAHRGTNLEGFPFPWELAVCPVTNFLRVHLSWLRGQNARPLGAGQISDHKGARELLPRLPKVAALLADRGYDSNWFRNALADQGTVPCIPPTKAASCLVPG
jgi:hypothetical protein